MARGRPSREVVHRRLNEALVDLRERFGGLPSPKEAEQIWSDIWHLETHHSTALEGNTLVLREVEHLLREGRTVGAKPLREYVEVKGYANASQWVYAQALTRTTYAHDVLVSVAEIRHIHSAAMSLV